MTEPATYDDDDDLDFTMSLKDWLEILDGDVDEAVAELEDRSGDLKQLVLFLRSKADAIAGKLDEAEEVERDEEDSE
jgi:hypothetical protein